MLQAEKDSLPVTDDEVEADLDQRVRDFVRAYGTVEAVEQVAGKTIYQIKEEARSSIRERKLAEAMQQKIVGKVTVTPAEVKSYFDRFPKDSLPFFESELEIGQIVLYPKASRDLELYIQNEMATYKKQVESKLVTFDQLAKKVSEDPGTKDKGGLFTVNRNDKQIDPTFMSATFRLKDGEISPVIKSQFGYHIILMVQRSGDDAVVRHILRIPPVTDVELKEGASKLDSVRSKLIAGTIDFNNAAGKYSEEPAQKYTGAYIMSRSGTTYNTIDELDKSVVAELGSLKVGEYSQPKAFTNDRGTQGVRLLYLKSRSEPHRMNIKDDYNKISTAALEEKKYRVLDKWMTEHITNYYIMIDPQEASCSQLSKFTAVAKAF
jgi:peptidyl-prolyl cis-trans isomerase SurA